MIILGNTQIGQLTEIHDNQVTNVTIGANEAKQATATPTTPKNPATSSTPDLSELELLLLNRLKEAGYLDSHYQLYTQESIQKGGQLLSTGQAVALSQQLGERCNVSKHIQRYCKQLWHMPQADSTLRSAAYKFNDESGEKAKRFWTAINRVMDGDSCQ